MRSSSPGLLFPLTCAVLALAAPLTAALAAPTARAVPAVYLPATPSSASQALCVAEVRRAFYAMTGQVAPAVTRLDGARPTLVIATPDDPLLRRISITDRGVRDAVATLKPGDYVLQPFGQNLLVAGSGADGLAAGAAALLRAYGCGFYLGGDSLPRRAVLPWPSAPQAPVTPRFKIRGLLPWYNFWDSPTTWNPGDWRAYLDSMARQRLNLIALHAYDYEPFCAYKWQGKWTKGAPLRTSADENWGCHPMKTAEQGFGTGRVYYQNYFGSDLATAGLPPGQAIEREQAMLADALAYAHAAGLRTCLGFEVSGDPTDPEELRQLDARLRHVLSRYPLDYLWIWEPEGMGINGTSPPPPTSRWGSYVRRWHSDFAYLGSEKRIAEAVRMTLYVQAAHEIMRGVAPKVRLAVAGWGGDHWLHFSDFFPGMDKILPRDVIFAALDNISVTPTISHNYGLVKDRELWPIPWFEYDGDQWVPHANCRAWAGAVADAWDKGCSGILGIHWRTRAIEQSAAYMAQYAWGDAGTFDGFYSRLAREWFGEEAGPKATPILLELQSLGYRWTGGGGESECGNLAWAPGRDDAKLAKLRQCRAGLAALLPVVEADPGAPQMAAERLRWLISMADWAADYELTARSLSGDGAALKAQTQAEAAAQSKASDAPAKASAALDLLSNLPFGRGMAGLAPALSDRGELGVLASINDKGWWDIQHRRQEMAKLAGKKLARTPDLVDKLGPAVVCFERPTTAPAGQEFRLRLALLGGAKGRFHWREWGGKWQTADLRPLQRDTYEALLPAEEVKPPGIEWYVEAADPAGRKARFPGTGGWVTSVVAGLPKAGWRDVEPPSGEPVPPAEVSARQLGYGGVELTWRRSPSPGAAYEVTRQAADGKKVDLGLTFDTWFEDCQPPPGELTYTVTPTYLGGKSGAGASTTLRLVAVKPAAPTGWAVKPGPDRVVITFPASEMVVRGWRVYLRRPGQGKWTAVAERPGAFGSAAGRTAVPAPGGKPVQVTVAALGPGGGEGDKATPVTVMPLAGAPQPVVVVASGKRGLPAGAQLVGKASFVDDGGHRALSFDGGWVQMPLPAALKDPCGLTLSLWIKPRGFVGQMPVVVDNGTWRQDGFFFQILGGVFRWHKAPSTDCDGGSAVAGKWQHVVCLWDGSESRVYVDGALVAHAPTDVRFYPADAPLYIGRYVLGDAMYFYHGEVRDLRLYPYALTSEEMKSLKVGSRLR